MHRQVAHTEARQGAPKTASLAAALRALNSGLTVDEHQTRFTFKNAGKLVEAYDIIVDASDNPGTRYLINDAAILAKKPLVSGAAVGTDGQLSVYGYKGGPCYRCLHPAAPPSGSFVSCSDAGVLGPITGVIGSLQALEVMKIAAAMALEREQESRKAMEEGSGDSAAEGSPGLLAPELSILLRSTKDKGRYRGMGLPLAGK